MLVKIIDLVRLLINLYSKESLSFRLSSIFSK